MENPQGKSTVYMKPWFPRIRGPQIIHFLMGFSTVNQPVWGIKFNGLVQGEIYRSIYVL